MKHLLFIILLGISIRVIAQDTSEKINQRNTENNIAIQGHDPVSYFTKGKAEKGNSKIASVYEGVTYYFTSEENKVAFVKNPLNYEPQYGGWCAFAMGDYGKKVSIDPKTFKIVDDKLYLFYHDLFTNTLTSWNKDEKNLKENADINWKKLTE